MRKDSSEKNQYVQFLNRACKNAVALTKYEKVLAVHEQSITEIKANTSKYGIYSNAISKAETRKQEIQAKVEDIKELISSLETVFVQEWTNALAQASCTETRLSHIQLPTRDEDVIQLTDAEKYNTIIKKLEEEADSLMKEKLDADELPNIRQEIKETEQSLHTMLRELQSKAEKQLAEQQDIIDTWNRIQSEQLERMDETRMIQDIKSELLGIPLLKEPTEEQELDKPLVDSVTQRALSHIIGQQLIEQFSTDKHDSAIYPHDDSFNQALKKVSQAHNAKVTKQEDNKKRLKAGLSRLSKMEKESDELLALFEKNVNADCVKQLQYNFEHIHDIMSNHAGLVTFLNQPDRKIQTERKSKGKEQASIPKFINLYENDRTLSNALATSLVHYTEECLFSDIKQRLENLESRI